MSDWFSEFVSAAAQLDWLDQQNTGAELPPDDEPEEIEVPQSAIETLRLARPDLFRGTAS